SLSASCSNRDATSPASSSRSAVPSGVCARNTDHSVYRRVELISRRRAALVLDSLMSIILLVARRRPLVAQEQVGGGLPRAYAGRDADAVVAGPGQGQPRRQRGPGHPNPVQVADPVLRQPAAPPVHAG